MGLIYDWNSETFSAVTSPMFKKPWYLNHFKFLARIGPSTELEITTQAVEARKQKLNEDLAGMKWKFAAHRSSSIILFVIIKK